MIPRLEDLETFAQMAGLSGSSDTPDLEEIEQQHPKVVTRLKPFSREKTMSLVGALLTYPSFHANTIRLETLQQLAQRNCQGDNTPTRHRLAQWLSELGRGWAAAMEDPVEDVFISLVVTSIGNSRVFEGIWEANDFWLQKALNALRAFRGEGWADNLFVEIDSVLALSEELAKRCNLPRFIMGAGSTRTDLDLPSDAELATRSANLCFRARDLSALRISRKALHAFIHDERPAAGTESKSTLQNKPLQQIGDDLVVALPAAISPAIRHYISQQLIRSGKIEAYETVLFTQQINELFLDGLEHLGAKRIEVAGLPVIPAGTLIKVQEVGQFDEGKFAHVLFVGDRMLDFAQDGVTGVLDLLDEGGSSILEHTQKCAEMIAGRRDFEGGLTIVVVGGLGRSFVCGFGEFPPHWFGSGFRLPDFVALSRVHQTKLLDIWKLKEQELSLRSRGVELMNVNGELNLLGFWRQHGERLVPRSVPLGGRAMVQVGTDFIAGVRHELRAKYDFHAIPRRNPDVWARVRRYNIDSYFREVEGDLIYVDEDAVREGRLRGVVETHTRWWWLSTVESYKQSLHRDTQFRIWEALLNWLPRFVFVAEHRFKNLPDGPIEIFLQFDALETWRAENLRGLPKEPPEILVKKSRRFPMVELTVPVGFLRVFAQPKNTAEQMLIAACFKGIAALTDEAIEFDCAAAAKDVVSNDDARFFHIAYAQNVRQHIGSTDHLQPRFVGEGDLNFVSVGVVQRLLPSVDANELVGEGDCNRFLHSVVDDCWDRVRTILQKLQRDSVVTAALKNVEAIEQDRNQWDLTAKAVLATHPDRENVLAAAGKRETERAEAGLLSRTIIEMAICTCPIAGSPISKANFDLLLGLTRLLLYAATTSDAIKHRLTPAKLALYPNGEFAADDDYYRTTVKPYTTEQFAGQFVAAAEDYADHFVNPGAQRSDAKPFETAFVDAFRAEYGLTPDELLDAYHAVEDEGMREELLVITRTNQQLRDVFVKHGLSSEAVNNVLHHFSLWPRAAWDQTPAGFSAKDWYPWRYRRRLSLLARPFIRLGNADSDSVVVAPGLVRDSVELMLIRLLSGWLPAEAFHSGAMRSWIGEITRRRGHEFEKEVGAELRSNGYETLVSRPMTIFGADKTYGDIDVFAWRRSSDQVFAIECKRLRSARTVAEIGEQLHEFEGEEMDLLARHVRRCQWLREHPETVRHVTAQKSPNIEVVPVLVTSTTVPMQFVKTLPIQAENVTPIRKLREWLDARRA